MTAGPLTQPESLGSVLGVPVVLQKTCHMVAVAT